MSDFSSAVYSCSSEKQGKSAASLMHNNLLYAKSTPRLTVSSREIFVFIVAITVKLMTTSTVFKQLSVECRNLLNNGKTHVFAMTMVLTCYQLSTGVKTFNSGSNETAATISSRGTGAGRHNDCI